MKRFLPFIIVAVVAAVAIGSGAWFYHTKKAASPALTISKTEKETGGEVVHSLGPDNAAVTLEEFGDYQCPPCGHLAEPINKLQKQYNLRVIFRNFPLAAHRWAKDAAYAAEAAGKQGKFWQMHDLLFHEQPVWSQSLDAPALFQAYAGMLQLDISKFRQDMADPEIQRQVEMDQHRGAAIGVKTTPTIFLNNQAVPGPELMPDAFPKAVEAAVNAAKPSS